MMIVPSRRTLMLKAQAGESTRGHGTSRGEYERGRASSRQGGTGDLPRKIYISRVSEKQSEALLRLFSQTILKENKPFFYIFT